MSNGTDQAKCGRITRRALAALLTLCVLLACMAGTAMAQVVASGNCGATGSSVQWTLDDAGTLTISGSGAMADYANANNQPWYNYGSNIKSVAVKDGVTAIGTNAFSNFANLVNINISDGVTSIGKSAFLKCTSLASIDIPGSVTSIGQFAFGSCSGLTNIKLPDALTSIGQNAFSQCHSLTEIIIPDSVTSIGLWAFALCNNLTSVRLSNNVTSIAGAFQRCPSLTSITIPDSVTSIDGAFAGCTALTSITIPDSVTNIHNAFSGCTSLSSITIPDSVTDIGYAFSGCTSLTSITIPASVEVIEENAFENCTSLTSITIPASVKDIRSRVFDGCSSLTTVNVRCDWDTKPLYDFGEGVSVNKTVHSAGGAYTVNGDGTHSFTCSVCDETVTEPHSINAETGKCACGEPMAVASVTIGGETTYYATLDEALTAAQGKTATVDLLKNAEIAVDHTIPSGVTFDGGKYAIAAATSDVRLDNEGTIAGGTFTATVVNRRGSVTGGSFNVLKCAGNSVSGKISFKTLFDLTNSTYDLSQAVDIEGATVWTGAAELPASKLKLPDGYALAVGGQIVSELPSMGSGTIVAHSHEYTIEDFDAAQHWNQCACGAATEKVDHTFTCKPVDGKEEHTVGCSGCSYTAPEEIPHEFSGGTCACGVTPVAKVDDDYFAVFANAVAAWEVESAKAMTLLADVTYGDVIDLEHICDDYQCFHDYAKILDLNGHTLTSTTTVNHALSHHNVPLTVNDSSADGTGKFIADSAYFSVIHSSSTTLTVNGGTFTNSNRDYALNLLYANAEVNSDNVKLEADKAPINVSGASDSNSLTITGSSCDGWKICNNCWNAVPISIPAGFHLEDEEGKKLEKNTELRAGAYTFIKADHVHAWSYAADDAADVITATCANADGHCPDPELSLTLSAADAVYSGNPVEAEVIRDGEDLTYTLRYTGNGYDSVDAPTDAGDYTVTMTVGDKSVSDTFTISPKKIANCAVALDKTTYEYSGGVPAFVIRAVDNGVGSYAMQMDTDYTVSASGTDVGEYKLTVTGTGNYTGSVELAYTIAPKPIAILSAAIEDVVYHPDGYALTVSEVVFDGVADGDTLTIGADYTAAAELTGENAANDAAKATVTVALTNGNYTLAEPTAEAAVRITQSATDMTAQTDETQYAYGDTITVSGSVEATGKAPEAQGFSLKRMFAAPAAMQAVLCDADGNPITDPVSVADGRYEIEYDTKGKLVQPGEGIRLTVRFTGNASMADRQAQTNAFTLRAKELTAQLTGSTAKTYDANTAVTDVSGLSITLEGVIEGDSVSAAAASFAFDDANAGTGKTVTAKGIALDGEEEDAPFYRLAADTAQAAVGTITPAAAPEITFPAAAPITYGQTLADSALTGGSTAHGRFVWQDASMIPPAGSGSYTVVFIPADAHNYNYAQTEGWNAQTGTVQRAVEIAVAKAVGQARVTLESWAYGAQPNAPVPQSTTHGTQNVTYFYKAKDAPESAYSAEIPTQIGEYTVRADFAGTDNYLPISAEADFAVTMSQTAFDGGLGVYNGDTQTTTFIYGDTITVRAKPVATGVSAFRRLLRAGVPQNHMALFIGDVQLCEAVAADENGVYEMTYDTAGKALPIGTSSITAQYVSDGYKTDYSQSADVILDRKALTVADVSAQDRIFNAGNKTVAVTGITLSGVVGSDLVYTQAQTADTGSDQVGTYETVALPKNLEPMGTDAQWYTISGSESAPANAGAGVQILPVPADLKLRVDVNEDFSDEDVRKTDLGNIPALDTVAEIDAALRVRVQEKGALSDSAVLYDVVLEYLDADGVTWVRADKEHFPEGGIRVVLPVIEGTTPATHTYTVAHMFTMNMRGHAAGEVEYPAAAAVQNEKGEWMLAFTVSGLSPVMVAAAPIPAVLPATGDSSSLALWMALACLSLAALAFSAKRRAL